MPPLDGDSATKWPPRHNVALARQESGFRRSNFTK
jgi:hypothetical protein